jgi:hypothetical protein
MEDLIVIGGRYFVYDEEGHMMIETDSEGVPLEKDEVEE